MAGKMDVFGLSDVGKVREVNEDQFLIADLNKSMLIHQTSLNLDDHTRLFGGSQGKLLLVADGMGGHVAGQRASSLAVDTITRYVLNTMSWFMQLGAEQEDDLREELKSALERCQERIEDEAAQQRAHRGMGTTLTLAYLLWPRLYVVHAGDSRCYLLRGGRLEQITTDHTVAQQMVAAGALPAEKAPETRWSHVLWNCIGGGSHELSPEVHKVTLQIGDTLLLCTDGLSGEVGNDRILEILRLNVSAEETCRRLVEAAHQVGAPDNITAVVARFHDGHQAAHAQSARAEAVTAGPASAQPSPAGVG